MWLCPWHCSSGYGWTRLDSDTLRRNLLPCPVKTIRRWNVIAHIRAQGTENVASAFRIISARENSQHVFSRPKLKGHMTEALLRLYVIGSKNELKSADCFLSLSMREKYGMSNSKVWSAFKFIMRCTGMAILYLVFLVPYLPLILIAGGIAAFALAFGYMILLHTLGFWPAIIISILMVGHFFAKCRQEDQYRYNVANQGQSFIYFLKSRAYRRNT